MMDSGYGLAARPFLPAPVVARYFPASSIEDARKRLSTALERGDGPALLIGAAGTGKSLLCQVLVESFRDRLQVVYLASGGCSTPLEVLQAILHELRLDYSGRDEGELRLALRDHLSQKASVGGLLLMIDDAESTPDRVLAELRNLTNLAREGKSLVRLVMVGSPELEEVFAHPRLESFNQRLAARCYLDAFNYDETRQYIQAQVAASGGDASQVFTDDALDAVHRASDGVPRLVNQLCDHALLIGQSAGASQLTEREIEDAWADLQQLPTSWSTHRKAPSEEKDANVSSEVVEFGTLDDGATLDSPRETAAVTQPMEPVSKRDDECDATRIDATETISSTVPLSSVWAQARDREAMTENLDSLEDRLTDLDEDFGAAGFGGGEFSEERGHVIVAPTTDPFGETFEEEEIILDHFASLQSSSAQAHRRVHCYESQELATALRQFTPAKPKLAEKEATPSVDTNAGQYDAVLPDDAPSSEEPDLRESVTLVMDDGRRIAAPRPQSGVSVVPLDSWTEAIDQADPEHEDLIQLDDDPIASVPRRGANRHDQLFVRLRRE